MTHAGHKPFICSVCSKAITRAYDLGVHKRVHSGYKPFVCEMCGKGFTQLSPFKRHSMIHLTSAGYRSAMNKRVKHSLPKVHMVSSDGEKQQAVFGESSGPDSGLGNHGNWADEEMRDGARQNMCDVCSKACTNAFDLKKHRQIHSGDKPFVCDACSKVFAEAISLKMHKWIHIGYKPFMCGVCGKQYTRAAYLKIHKMTHTGHRPFVCDICSKAFTQLGVLRRHKMTHAGHKPFKCDVLIEKLNEADHMTKHFITRTTSTRYPTTTDTRHAQHSLPSATPSTQDGPFVFTDNSSVNVHMVLLDSEKLQSECFESSRPDCSVGDPGDGTGEENKEKARRHVCDVCSKAFTNAFNLEKHKRIHTGHKPFVCDVCTKAFTQSHDLRRHKKIHTRHRPFVCDKCGKAFAQMGHLKEHRRIHIACKPYLCDVCSKQFTWASTLKDHKVTHTGLKLFVCDVCSEAFTQLQRLKKHRRIHDGHKPLCDVCGKQFTESGHLKKHMIIHTESASYQAATDERQVQHSSPFAVISATRSPLDRPDVCQNYSDDIIQNGSFKMHIVSSDGEKKSDDIIQNESFKMHIVSSDGKKEEVKFPQFSRPDCGIGDPPDETGGENKDRARRRVCDVCSKTFTNTFNVEKHVRIHTGHRPFVCDVCTKAFTQSHDSKRHKRIHIGPKPYVCDECGKTFTQFYSLKKHEVTHACRKPFICDVCREQFTGAGHLKKHLTIHTNTAMSQTAADKRQVQHPLPSAVISTTPLSLDMPEVCQNDSGGFVQNDNLEMSPVSSDDEKQKVLCPKASRPDCGIGNLSDGTGKENKDRARRRVCDVCSKAFTNAFNLEKHMRIHTGHRPFVCDVCDKAFTQSHDLKRHKRIHTSHKPFACNVCSKAFTQNGQLKIHMITHVTSAVHQAGSDKGQIQYSVPSADISTTPPSLDRPDVHHNSSDDFVQNDSLEIVSSDRGKQRAVFVDSSRPDFGSGNFGNRTSEGDKDRARWHVCDVCSKAFTKASNLEKHKRIHTGHRPFVCDVCSKAFVQSHDLKRHKRIHTGHNPQGQTASDMKVDHYSSVFDENNSFKNQTLSSQGEEQHAVGSELTRPGYDVGNHAEETGDEKRDVARGHACDICSKAYRCASSLKKHKLIHSSHNPFVCDVCSKAFTAAHDLRRHTRIHAGYKPFACDVCGRAFTQKGQLKEHERTHTGYKPFLCDVCSKQFTRAYFLKAHMVIHTGQRPFACDICGKTFTQFGSLKAHKRTKHACHQPFMCDVCSKPFTEAAYLMKHMMCHMS